METATNNQFEDAVLFICTLRFTILYIYSDDLSHQQP